MKRLPLLTVHICFLRAKFFFKARPKSWHQTLLWVLKLSMHSRADDTGASVTIVDVMTGIALTSLTNSIKLGFARPRAFGKCHVVTHGG